MSKRKYRSAGEWKALIEEQIDSGLTGVAFCNERGLSAKSFYKQRKRLGYPGRQIAAQRPSSFVQVQPIVSAVASQALILHYRDSRLELGSDIEASWLAELLRALS